MSIIRKTKSSIDFRGRQFLVTHDELPASDFMNSELIYPPRGATLTLLRMLPKRRIESSLEIGTGHGLVAVVLTTISHQVVATDISSKCLTYAKETAKDNECFVELREGSLFEAVGNEFFDLVVGNLPFVIDDPLDHIYRKSPLSGDELLPYLLRETPPYLTENGEAIFLINWLSDESGQIDIEEVESQVWIGIREILSISEYVDVWLDDVGVADTDIRNQWMESLSKYEKSHICLGFVVIRNSTPHFNRVEDLRSVARMPEGDEILQRMQSAELSEEITAMEILDGEFSAATLQGWRGDVSLDTILVKVREGKKVSEVVNLVRNEHNLDESDILAHCLTGVKQLVDWGLLSRKTPKI